MRNFLRLIGAALALAVLAVPASAQFQFIPVNTDAYPVSGALSAVNTDNALFVKFIGTKGSAGNPTVAVTGNNSMAFTTDGSTADPAMNPASGTQCGAVVGTLDLTNANCNTYIKLINRINASGTWLAVPGGIIGTDVPNANVNNIAATNAATEGGVAITKLTSGALNVAVELTTPGSVTGLGSGSQVIPYDMRFWLSKGPGSNKLNVNPWFDYATYVTAYSATSTYASGTSTIKIYGVFPKFTYTGTTSTAPTYTETVRTIWSLPGGATTVNFNQLLTSFPIMSAPGERVIIRIENSAALTAPVLNAFGIFARFPQR